MSLIEKALDAARRYTPTELLGGVMTAVSAQSTAAAIQSMPPGQALAVLGVGGLIGAFGLSGARADADERVAKARGIEAIAGRVDSIEELIEETLRSVDDLRLDRKIRRNLEALRAGRPIDDEAEASVASLCAVHLSDAQRTELAEDVRGFIGEARVLLWTQDERGRRVERTISEVRSLLLTHRSALRPTTAILIPNTLDLPDDPDRLSPAQLLNAKRQAVTYIPEALGYLWDDLDQWRRDEVAFSVRLFTGPGGRGKTRLFIEWARVLRERHGWQAGFLGERVSDDDLRRALSDPRPTLLVIDYAEARADLEAVLRVAHEAKREAPLFIALAARNLGDWWEGLKEDLEALETVLASNSPTELAEIPIDGALRERVFRRALDDFAIRLGRSAPERTPDLSGERFGRALYLQMAALATLEGISTDAGADALLRAIVKHEQRFWEQRIDDPARVDHTRRKVFRNAAARLIGAITLRGGVETTAQAMALSDRVEGPGSDSVEREAFVAFLATLYPRIGATDGQGLVAPLEPDLLGEQLVADVLRDPKGSLDAYTFLQRTLEDAASQEWQQAFIVLGRLSIRGVDKTEHWMAFLLALNLGVAKEPALNAALAIATESESLPLADMLASRMERTNDVHFADVCITRIPEATLSLLRLSIWSYRTFLRHLEDLEPAYRIRALRARLLNLLGIRLSELGLREEALAVTRQSVDLYRDLSTGESTSFLPLLASSLNNLGLRHRELGDYESALLSAKQSLRVRQILARSDPDTIRRGLASSQNNLAVIFGLAGHPIESLNAAKTAIAQYRILASKQNQAVLPSLAMALNQIAVAQLPKGEIQEALDNSSESVETYRTLYDAQPDGYLPGLAASLSTLAQTRLAAGQSRGALDAADEAVAHNRRLIKREPARFTIQLAESIAVRGRTLHALGRTAEAVACLDEAIKFFQGRAESDPTVVHGLASTKILKDKILADSRSRLDALKAARESVQFLTEKLPLDTVRLGPLLVERLIAYIKSLDDPEAMMSRDQVVARAFGALEAHGIRPWESNWRDPLGQTGATGA